MFCLTALNTITIYCAPEEFEYLSMLLVSKINQNSAFSLITLHLIEFKMSS